MQGWQRRGCSTAWGQHGRTALGTACAQHGALPWDRTTSVPIPAGAHPRDGSTPPTHLLGTTSLPGPPQTTRDRYSGHSPLPCQDHIPGTGTVAAHHIPARTHPRGTHTRSAPHTQPQAPPAPGPFPAPPGAPRVALAGRFGLRARCGSRCPGGPAAVPGAGGAARRGPGDVRSGPAAVGGPSPAPGSARRPPLLRARLGGAPLRPRLGEERGQPRGPAAVPLRHGKAVGMGRAGGGGPGCPGRGALSPSPRLSQPLAGAAPGPRRLQPRSAGLRRSLRAGMKRGGRR